MNCGLQQDGNPIHAHCPECQHEQIERLKGEIAELEAVVELLKDSLTFNSTTSESGAVCCVECGEIQIEERGCKKDCSIGIALSRAANPSKALDEVRAKVWREASLSCGVMSDPRSRQYAIEFEAKAVELENA